MPGPGKCKTIDRKRRKPAQKRATAERRWEKNKERNHKTHLRRVETKKKKAEKIISSVKIVSDYKKVRNICPKLCAEAHQKKREELHLTQTLPGDGFPERFVRDHPAEITDKKEIAKYLEWFLPKRRRSYTMVSDKTKKG